MSGVISQTHYFEYGETEISHLRKKDKKLGAYIDQVGIIKRKVTPNLFTALVESVISQQISAKAAETVCRSVSELCETDSQKLHDLTIEQVQACGMSVRKAGYIKHIAQAVVSKSLDLDALSDKSDQEVVQTLTALKGVGQWTAEMLLIFSLMRPNVVSYGDLAIRRGMMRLYGLKDLEKDRFLRYARRYAPYGSVASLYLWKISV